MVQNNKANDSLSKTSIDYKLFERIFWRVTQSFLPKFGDEQLRPASKKGTPSRLQVTRTRHLLGQHQGTFKNAQQGTIFLPLLCPFAHIWPALSKNRQLFLQVSGRALVAAVVNYNNHVRQGVHLQLLLLKVFLEKLSRGNTKERGHTTFTLPYNLFCEPWSYKGLEGVIIG